MDAQADLSHCWVHMSEGTFSQAVANMFFSYFSRYPLAVYLGICAVGGVYFTDWQVIVTKIPYYRQQFKDEDVK